VRAVLFALALTSSCVGTTGSGIVSFPAYASGPADAMVPLTFTTAGGFQVALTTATMHIGAVYVTDSAPNPSSQNTSCIEPGRYIAEVAGPVDVNLLSAAPQPFSVMGTGTVDVAQTAEIWLTGGDINAQNDSTEVVTVAGTATRGSTVIPFSAKVTIGDNRLKRVSDVSQPGLNPICKRRIVQVSPLNTSVADRSALYVRVDPRGWFNSVDFTTLELAPTEPPSFEIPDDDFDTGSGADAGRNFFTGILTGVLPSGVSAYSFQFEKM